VETKGEFVALKLVQVLVLGLKLGFKLVYSFNPVYNSETNEKFMHTDGF
jgi:hypothetical protein